jgi:hypothetical protein
MQVQLINLTMHDGSRHFVSLAESCPPLVIHEHLARLDGIQMAPLLFDGVSEAWIDFDYQGYHFTINNQYGEYWFFVSDPTCPDAILTQLVNYCQQRLSVSP